MSVAKNIEITATSPTSFEDAIEKGIARTFKNDEKRARRVDQRSEDKY